MSLQLFVLPPGSSSCGCCCCSGMMLVVRDRWRAGAGAFNHGDDVVGSKGTGDSQGRKSHGPVQICSHGHPQSCSVRLTCQCPVPSAPCPCPPGWSLCCCPFLTPSSLFGGWPGEGAAGSYPEAVLEGCKRGASEPQGRAMTGHPQLSGRARQAAPLRRPCSSVQPLEPAPGTRLVFVVVQGSPGRGTRWRGWDDRAIGRRAQDAESHEDAQLVSYRTSIQNSARSAMC